MSKFEIYGFINKTVFDSEVSEILITKPNGKIETLFYNNQVIVDYFKNFNIYFCSVNNDIVLNICKNPHGISIIIKIDNIEKTYIFPHEHNKGLINLIDDFVNKLEVKLMKQNMIRTHGLKSDTLFSFIFNDIEYKFNSKNKLFVTLKDSTQFSSFNNFARSHLVNNKGYQYVYVSMHSDSNNIVMIYKGEQNIKIVLHILNVGTYTTTITKNKDDVFCHFEKWLSDLQVTEM